MSHLINELMTKVFVVQPKIHNSSNDDNGVKDKRNKYKNNKKDNTKTPQIQTKKLLLFKREKKLDLF